MLRPLLAFVALASVSHAGDDPRSASAEVDRLVAERLASEGRAAPATVDDETFLRRVYLDVLGRIPTAAEARTFLGDARDDRRTRLVDRLLDAPGYEAHMFHWWADLLRAKHELQGPVSGAPFVDWIKTSIADDRPYDDMVAEMLAAEGPAHERGNGATGYHMRDRGMPEDNMSNTVRVFLGMHIECAQCHDDPFDDWTQRQYYELVAFTGGIQYKLDERDSPEGRRFKSLRQQLIDAHGSAAKGAFRRAFGSLAMGVEGTGAGAVQLPHDYAYDDADPGEYVTARTLEGEVITPPPAYDRKKRVRSKNKPRHAAIDQGTRAVFADWLTSTDNELFVRTIANRMWKRVMGRGLIEPVDDLTPDDLGEAPELLAHLEALMLAVDFDLREFQRVLLHTRAYQGVATSDPSAAFPGAPTLRRLTANQVWDSWMTLIVPDLDGRLAAVDAEAEEVYDEYETLLNADDATLLEVFERSLLRRTDRDAYDDLVAGERARKREVKRLTRKFEKATMRGRDDTAAQFAEALAALGALDGAREAKDEDPWLDAGFARARDLPAPAEPDHLLRTFGQSDRTLTMGGHVDPTVPQALAMMNGVVDEWIAHDETTLLTALARSSDPIETAFLSVLARRPTADERALWAPDVDADRTDALVDLVWTLLNTHEFLFLR